MTDTASVDTHNYTDPSGSIGSTPADTNLTGGISANTNSSAFSGLQANATTPVNGSAPVIPTTISSASLTTATPVTIPQTAPNSYITPTVTAPTGTTIGTSGQVTVTPPPVAEPTTLDNIKASLGSLGNILGTKSAVTTQLQNDTQLATKTQAAAQSYNAYNQAKIDAQQQIENMYNQPGVSREALAPSVAEFTRKSNANLANLAIKAQSDQGLLSAAQQTIKDKLDAQFQPVQDQIDYLLKYAQVNNNDLTDKQKIQLENQRFVMQNDLDQLKAAKLSAHQFALTQGIQDTGVLNAIDAAKTPADVYQAVGGSISGFPNSDNQSPMVPTPLSPKDKVASLSSTAQQYVDNSADGIPFVSQDRLDNLTPYQKQQLSAEYAKAGIRILQSGEVSALNTIDQAGADLKLFENAANSLLTPGLLGRLKGMTTNQFSQWAQTNPEWRQFQGLRAGLVKSVQGIAAGAPGLRVTGAELANAADALPNSADNLESSQQAVATFKDLLNVNKNILLRNATVSPGTNTGVLPVVKTKAGEINPNF